MVWNVLGWRRMKFLTKTSILVLACMATVMGVSGEETLPALVEGKVPQNFEELWQGFDPRKEALDVEVLKEWEEDGIVMKVVRYRVGIYKGEKAMLAAVYGYPKGGENLPGLVQIHGGGQYADYRAVLSNAKRGYATISISWAGRLNAPDYNVNPEVVKLFWDAKTEDPAYRLTTDWGALDGYHAPSRNGKDAFMSIPVASWTMDAVKSPRNNSWFLATMAARRALTFLEKQAEVDPSKLGVYGHSMGGKLTVLTAGSDSRVKAAAPSCGGISDRYNSDTLHHNSVGDASYLKNISCPIIFLSPANDFHGHINDLPEAVRDIKTKEWRVTCSAYLNHRDMPSGEVVTQLWFDEHLKGEFLFPQTPVSDLVLDTGYHVPVFSVTPDDDKKVVSVDIYYTQQGVEGGDRKLRVNRINRHWVRALADKEGEVWTAKLPVADVEKGLWAYANVKYELKESVSGVGYYYGDYTAKTFSVSSLVKLVKPGELKEAGVLATARPSLMIESFEGDWERNFFRHQSKSWEYRTHKVYSPLCKAPEGGSLSIELSAEEVNTFVVGIDGYVAEVSLPGGGEWETVVLGLADFKDVNSEPLESWEGILELRLSASEHLRSGKGGEQVSRKVGGVWKGNEPEFRNLRWIELENK